ncbi:TetR/AcrR family transcriptional regulator [Streptomyces sp. NPDC054766]|uniref:TetR/AcrR family transcriptional regulator n=1 Tax=Streptomyces rhizosphaerihabitans TaxID=1266770 RepID=UPI0021C107A4|nr:TetR family transcriptional regulator [Streptomyces rhizosphaerihabitans]MCT9007687.1 TetR family transcriptional regulator [Streptomyces rhizosphaerihabitans]
MPERTEKPGLRERKKDETRRGLREAAGRLFAEHGFAHTTVADIAAEANVSERTFFRYFDSKEALLLPDGIELFARIEAAFLARPDSDTPLEAACGAITDAVSYFAASSLTALAHPLDEIREQAREGLSRQFQQFEERLTELVLERLPAGAPDTDLQAAVIANCALSAARAVLRTLRNRRTAQVPVEPDRLLPQAFTFLTMIGATTS